MALGKKKWTQTHEKQFKGGSLNKKDKVQKLWNIP